MPVAHGDHVQVASDVILGVKKLRQLADGQTVARGERKIADEAGLIGVEHRSFDDFTPDRIGPVQHEN